MSAATRPPLTIRRLVGAAIVGVAWAIMAETTAEAVITLGHGGHWPGGFEAAVEVYGAGLVLLVLSAVGYWKRTEIDPKGRRLIPLLSLVLLLAVLWATSMLTVHPGGVEARPVAPPELPSVKRSVASATAFSTLTYSFERRHTGSGGIVGEESSRGEFSDRRVTEEMRG